MRRRTPSGARTKQQGFSAVELLVTLFVAAAFLIAAYQLYSAVIKNSGENRATTRATVVATNYLNQYKAAIGSTCVASNPAAFAVTATGLVDVTVDPQITCRSGLPSLSIITVTVSYNYNPRQTVVYTTYEYGG